MKRRKNSGQAITELLVLLLAFAICFLGLLLVMGLSIANIEIFLDAKSNSETRANVETSGHDGNGIASWRYTFFSIINEYIPFLADDRPGFEQEGLDNFTMYFNSPGYSQPTSEYVFNDYLSVNFKVSDNFAYDAPGTYYEAANLLRGRSFDFSENIITIKDKRYFDRRKTYTAFERILGVKLGDIDLENTYSNTVYMPAMKVLDK